MPILISAAELAAVLPTVRVLDVRWSLGAPDGSADHLAGHVPGAVYVDLDADLARHGDPRDGRHPLPDTADLQEAARGWGLDDGDTVVVYDGAGNLAAARAWWLLRDAGVADVRLLDGALPAWVAAGLPLATGPERPARGTITLRPHHLSTVDIDAAAAFPADGVLLDARAGARYRGETELVDPRAGHIPGAVSAPTSDNLAEDGTFLPADRLRERFTALGVDGDRPVAAYCGSGVTAAHTVVALTIAGFSPALYPGSWSQWANHPDRPVATGPARA
ncbi:sulfurtransferase [Umezawaea endophytica]|uniref:Sulfurtransferase n=1 Tax=Umezawaea endophytica TaxID=1654476 RepID=A0A9X2VFC1_9PSEU|nr:sulfurtransferase [Umezawaea endophytica]MCS7475490.1 sulfurtransferase [Umezawaea endophytica]